MLESVTRKPTSSTRPSFQADRSSAVRLPNRVIKAAARCVPIRTVRMRLSLIYGALFLVSGAALLAITYLLVAGVPVAPPLGFNPPAGSGNGVIGIAVERAHVLQALLLRSGIALGIMALVSFWLGWLVAGRALRPVRTITSTARRITEENLHERLALSGPDDELKELGDTIDELLAASRRSF